MALERRTFYGSGTLYELPVPENFVMPTTVAALKTLVETYCTADNQIGFLKNGFQVQIETDKLEDQSDLGEMKVDIITKETGTITSALFNSNGETISRLYPTAHTTDGVTTVGGLNGADQTDHLIIFVEATKTDGKQTVFVAYGKNTSGFTINWNPDSVEPFSIEYGISPYDSTGKLFVMASVSNLPALPITGDTTYTITYVMNGGEWASEYSAPASYQHGSGDDITLPTSSNISKTDATFGGWFEESDLGTAVTAIDVSEESGNRTFIAKWTA